MIAMAISAFVLGVGIETRRLWRLSDQYRAIADICASHEMFHRKRVRWFTAKMAEYAEYAAKFRRGEKTGNNLFDEAIESSKRDLEAEGRNSQSVAIAEDSVWVEYHATVFDKLVRERRDLAQAEQRKLDHYSALTQKYKRAARYPWLPVEPDPPDPW